MPRVSLGGRLALLFAVCTAAVSLTAGLLFSRASNGTSSNWTSNCSMAGCP